MRRILLRALLPALAILFAVIHTQNAQAANSTCSTHYLALASWGTADDHIDTLWDFQCGGANNEDYKISLTLQKKTIYGVWQVAGCDTGFACAADRPTINYYDGGTRHSGENHWNVDGQIDCHPWRLHGVVEFAGPSPAIVYNSAVSNIGGVGC